MKRAIITCMCGGTHCCSGDVGEGRGRCDGDEGVSR